MLEGVGLGVGIAGTPLIPVFPISIEPIGIPARLAPLGEIVEADGFMALTLVVDVPTQGEFPFPSTTVPAAPPVPAEAPIVLMPPPSKLPVELVPDLPDVELPAVEHGVALPIIEPYDGALYGIGLTPVVPSSVAPRGIPAGPTDGVPAMPNGEVAPIPGVGLPIPPTCARTGLQPKSAASIAAFNARRIVISIVLSRRVGIYICPILNDTLGRLNRTVPSYAGSHSYFMGLTAPYLGFGRKPARRSTRSRAHCSLNNGGINDGQDM
jgi:hypothetical protein